MRELAGINGQLIQCTPETGDVAYNDLFMR
jgi:hypothetical protein